MTQYIGDLRQYLCVQYARSDRSKCRKCKENIEKHQLRIGIMFDDDTFSTKNWFHPDCFNFKPRHHAMKINHLEQHINGLKDLNSKDHSKVINLLKKDFKQLQHHLAEPRKKRIEEKMQIQASKGRTPKKTLPINEQAQQRKILGKKLIKPRAKSSTEGPSHHTAQFNKMVQIYVSYPQTQLKRILQKNGQVKTGKKQELAERCADGKLYGQIPPCPKCGGGKLRYDQERLKYICPGYMEDTDFVHCDGKFDVSQVKRAQWIE